MSLTRRQFISSVAAGTAVALGCGNAQEELFTSGGGNARLTARPGVPSVTVTPGTYLITDTRDLDGALIVPSSYNAAKPMPLMVGLHGAGGRAAGQLNLMGPYAESAGFLFLAIGSRGVTWDAMTFKYLQDVLFIDSALKWAFQRCNVNASRVAIEGFSDGASYTLGLALANGDLFTHAIAFSPGFIPKSDSPQTGRSKYFDSHGTADTILNIDGASRVIVPTLRNAGYDVTYQEFAGGHEVPPAIARQAVSWMSR